jgi:hypothetical protein
LAASAPRRRSGWGCQATTAHVLWTSPASRPGPSGFPARGRRLELLETGAIVTSPASVSEEAAALDDRQGTVCVRPPRLGRRLLRVAQRPLRSDWVRPAQHGTPRSPEHRVARGRAEVTTRPAQTRAGNEAPRMWGRAWATNRPGAALRGPPRRGDASRRGSETHVTTLSGGGMSLQWTAEDDGGWPTT